MLEALERDRPSEPAKEWEPCESLTPMSDIDLMIANGWGETPQHSIPSDWRTRIKPARKPGSGKAAAKVV